MAPLDNGPRTPDDTLGTLLRGIADDMKQLVRAEVELARLEIGERFARSRAAAVRMAAAAASLIAASLLLLVALALGLADAFDWPAWAGFLLVAAFLTLTGVVAAGSARRQIGRAATAPRETLATLKENARWIAMRLSSGAK